MRGLSLRVSSVAPTRLSWRWCRYGVLPTWPGKPYRPNTSTPTSTPELPNRAKTAWAGWGHVRCVHGPFGSCCASASARFVSQQCASHGRMERVLVIRWTSATEQRDPPKHNAPTDQKVARPSTQITPKLGVHERRGGKRSLASASPRNALTLRRARARPRSTSRSLP